MFKTSLFSSSDTNFPALGIDKPQNIKMDQTDDFWRSSTHGKAICKSILTVRRKWREKTCKNLGWRRIWKANTARMYSVRSSQPTASLVHQKCRLQTQNCQEIIRVGSSHLLRSSVQCSRNSSACCSWIHHLATKAAPWSTGFWNILTCQQCWLVKEPHKADYS